MANKEVIERSVNQLNTYGNGVGVLLTKQAKAIGLKSGSKVQISSIKEGDKKYIIIEKFPIVEE